MEVAAFAEQVLFGERLADKLVEPGELTDSARPPAIALPDRPGRPAGLSLGQPSARAPMPKATELDRAGARGRLLHFFANHELLALELMALSLLRFPDTPAAYRRGVVGTLRDEQEHLRLYLARMKACGIELGDQPVNDFFWRWLRVAEDPMDFVVHMNLTFEQANLDYAQHFARAFSAAGDEETAALLRRIGDDEIGHVKHGLIWFNRWREPAASEWDAYRSHLKRPLGPFRAKGIGFNREARRRVGFTEDYIEELSVSSESQGRPPCVHWFDPTVEDAIAAGKGYVAPAPVRELVADLETLPMFGAAHDDVVWVRRAPRARFLAGLRAAGFRTPELVGDDRGGREALADRRLAELRPWGWSPRSAERLGPLRGQLTGGPESSPRWSEALGRLYSKAFGVEQLRALLEVEHDERLCDIAVVGRVCGSRAEVVAAVGEATTAGSGRVVVKAAFGAAGRNRRFFASTAIDRSSEAWLDATLAQQGAVVVEPWLDRAFDFSCHFSVLPSGDVAPDGLVRFLTDDRGGFQGAVLGRRFDDLDADGLRFVYGAGRDPKWLERLFGRIAARLAEPIQATGYFGPVGIDALVFRDVAGQLRLKPIVEINPRHTMGRVALHLERHLWRGRAGLWRFLSLGAIRSAGFESASALAQRAAERWPVEVGRTPAARLRGGVLFTTDPERARRVVTLLSVAPNLDTCRAQLRDLLTADGAG